MTNRSAVLRLADFLDRTPNAWDRFSLAEIASVVGVSRQRVKQLMAGRSKPRPRRVADALLAFLAEHPEALLASARGGMSKKAIAIAIRRSPIAVRRTWSELHLPVRKPLSKRERYERGKLRHDAATRKWIRAHPDRIRELRNKANTKWLAKVIRSEVCLVCGREFSWTNRDQYQRRRATCSPECRRTANRSLASGESTRSDTST